MTGTTSRISIVADSAVCIAEEKLQQYKIRLVPEIIIFGDDEYRDGVDIQRHDFYRMLADVKEIPTTSAPSPEQFIDVFREAAGESGSIVCILVTSGFSSMGMQSAIKAKEALPDIQIELIDSRTAVGAYGFVVLAAARAAAEGKPMREVIAAAEAMKQKVNMIATLNTMKYLVKGGRVGKATHWATKLFNIKPIISVPTSTGVLEPVERIKTRQKSLLRLLEIVEENTGTEGITLHASIDHAGAWEDAGWLRKELMDRFESHDIDVNDWAPAAGVHCGPGVIGISYYID